jgi:hypothetical protein
MDIRSQSVTPSVKISSDPILGSHTGHIRNGTSCDEIGIVEKKSGFIFNLKKYFTLKSPDSRRFFFFVWLRHTCVD